MYSKAVKIGVVVLFFAVIAVSAVFSDFKGGKISESQNRRLAEFPDIESEDMDFEKFTEGFESWSNDNIGFQETYSRFYAKINTAAGIPTTDSVHYGRDGFYFITDDNSVDIATGKHVISEETLREIAETQQAVSDYYKSRGKTYYVVLVPGKASVYPEKIRGGSFEVTETTVDKIEKYLTENTDVRVINVKGALLECKEQGNLVFMKTDTHWTPVGAYAAYNTIMDRLIADGEIDVKADLDPDFSKTKPFDGDLGGMIGIDALPPEPLYYAEWKANFVLDQSSSEYTAVSDTIDTLSRTTKVELFRNEKRYLNSSENVNHKTLQIYGDSLFLDVRQIKQFFAESFETVQYLRVRSVCEELDLINDPDIVIYSAYERLAEHVLTNKPLISADSSVLDSLEEISVNKSDVWNGNNGMLAEIKEQGSCKVENQEIVLDGSLERYDITGWALDFNLQTDLKDLFVFADDIPIKVIYGKKGTDVGKHFGFENVQSCRFSFSLRRDFLIKNNIKQLKFVMVSSDGVHKYEPVVYNVTIE